MSQGFENVEVNGHQIQTTTTWTPYNPFTMPVTTKVLELEEITDWDKKYREHVLGYSGITPQQYITTEASVLKDKLDNNLIIEDEFTLMKWVYQLVQHHGDENEQQVFQMPEDFFREFIKDKELDDLNKSVHSQFDPESKYLWVSAKLTISPIHIRTSKKSKCIPFFNLKFITLMLWKLLQENNRPITYQNLCHFYSEFNCRLWDKILNTKLDDLKQPPIKGWLEDGQQYTIDSNFIEITKLQEFAAYSFLWE